MIDISSFEKADYFTNEFLQQCKQNANIPQFLTRETKNIIKEMALVGRLYSQVLMIRRSIINTKVTKEALVKYKENNDNISMN